MENKNVRVRFAPSPTGLMHLGGVRTALFNYLFAKQHNGVFILRIEDTDAERNFDPGAQEIMRDLSWLNLFHDEGPIVGGPHAPYFQSERSPLYQEKLTLLRHKNLIYRCFCTAEELEKKRKRQIALKQPPRYDQTCLSLDQSTLEKKLEEGAHFIWRFKIDHSKKIHFTDLARGTQTFDLHNFSDFALTRQDGSFTFLFVNCIDDIAMRISHVLRGEDHLSNTANQVALYHAFEETVPLFWHLPVICNNQGKKLSKRDFGFSLKDLQQAGFLPQALCNYLAIIGDSFEKEIMSLPQLIEAINFNKINSTGAIKYDIEKLKWVNQQWIALSTPQELAPLLLPFLAQIYPTIKECNEQQLMELVRIAQPEISTLKESVDVLKFFFEKPVVTKEKLLEYIPEKEVDVILEIIQKVYTPSLPMDLFLSHLQENTKKHAIANKMLFMTLRLLLSGSTQGPSVKAMLSILRSDEINSRINLLG